MKLIKLLLLSLLFLLQCTEPKPDWSVIIYGISEIGKEIVIIDELHSHLLKTTDGEWRYLQEDSDFKYSNHTETVMFSGKENVYLQSKLDSTIHNFKVLEPKSIGLWALQEGMLKDFVAKHFKSPDTTMFSPSGAEQWHYADGKMVVFDEKNIIKIYDNYVANKDYSKVVVGMHKEEVKNLIGQPNWTNQRDSKWHYDSKMELIFRKDTLYKITEISDSEFAFKEWRESVIANIDERNLVERNIPKDLTLEQITGTKNMDFEDAKIFKIYGIKEKQESYLPVILIYGMNQSDFPTNLNQLEKELNALSIEKEAIRNNLSVSDLLKDFDMKRPVLIKDRQMYVSEATVESTTGEKYISKQAIYFRYNQLLMLQISLLAEDRERYMKYFDQLIDDFDI